MKDSAHFCYILECSDGTLYTGYTTNLKRRLQEHNAGIGAKYTRGRIPCKLVYFEEFSDKTAAMKREYAIKHYMTREEKVELIQNKK